MPELVFSTPEEFFAQIEDSGIDFPVVHDELRQNTFEIPYGCITRCDDGREQPGQSWVDVTGIMPGTSNRYGVSIINDGKYSFDVSNNVLGMTVLRSPVYANHDPYKPCADEDYSFIDQGLQHFSYKILPHDGGWEEAGTVKKAALFNQKLVLIVETYHEGTLPQRHSFLTVDVDNVIVEVVICFINRDGCKKPTSSQFDKLMLL